MTRHDDPLTVAVEQYLRQRGAHEPPVDLKATVMSAVSQTRQRRPSTSRFEQFIRVAGAIGAASVATIVLISFLNTVRTPSSTTEGPAASAVASRFVPESAGPTTSVAATPSKTPEISAAKTCENALDGYTLEYPAQWFTIDDPESPCRYFGPDPLQVSSDDRPGGVAIVVDVVSGDIGLVGELVTRTEVLVGGRPGLRIEQVGQLGGVLAAGERLVEYIGFLDASPEEAGRSLVLSAVEHPAFDANVAVLDRMVESLVLRH